MTDNRTTEKLRRMLDERGVEWSETVNSIGCVFTWYESAYFGEVGAMDNCDGYLYFNELNGVCLTPEQAIAATLGGGECDAILDESYYKGIHGYCECLKCSNCGEPLFNEFKSCPWCGKRIRKKVDE